MFYNLQATSAYEVIIEWYLTSDDDEFNDFSYQYLEKRFGGASRLVASLAYSLQMIMYMGIVLYAPALALEALTGLNKNWSILLVGVVCTFYSTIGGMKAVLFADVFQSLLMYSAVLSIVISGIYYAGGVTDIFKVANEGNRLELWKWVMKTFWLPSTNCFSFTASTPTRPYDIRGFRFLSEARRLISRCTL